MGVWKKAFMVKLDEDDARWVESQSPVFGTRSAFIRLIVKVFRNLIAAGIIDWDIPELQELLRNHKGSERRRTSGRLLPGLERDEMAHRKGQPRHNDRSLRTPLRRSEGRHQWPEMLPESRLPQYPTVTMLAVSPASNRVHPFSSPPLELSFSEV